MKKTILALSLAACGAAFAQSAGQNPFARPTSQPAPASPVNGAAAGAPAVPPNNMPYPVMQPMPGVMPGQPAIMQPGQMAPSGPEVVEEEVSVVRVGKVNGQYLYRGTGAYLFEPTNKKKVVRKPTVAQSGAAGLPAAMPAIPVPGAAAQPVPALPNMVGRPAPTK